MLGISCTLLGGRGHHVMLAGSVDGFAWHTTKMNYSRHVSTITNNGRCTVYEDRTARYRHRRVKPPPS